MTNFTLPADLEDLAETIHEEAFVFDACLPGDGMFQDEDAEIEALRLGKVDGANLTIADYKADFRRTVDGLNSLRALVERHRAVVALCSSVSDLARAESEGKTGLVVHFQDARPIEDNIDYLATFYQLGLRVFQLTYNSQGFLGTGCCERHEAGLTYLGLDALAKCNELGILIDLSHCSWATCWDAIKHSEAPVALTHVGCYELCPAHGRNKSDDLIRAVAATGGIIGVTFFPSLIKRNAETQLVLPSATSDVLDHIDHVVSLVGADHVGFGSDLSNYYARTLEVPATSSIRWYRPLRPDVYGVGPTDLYDPYPDGLTSHSELANLTRGLLARGYQRPDVEKILGGNWLRLFEAVWQ